MHGDIHMVVHHIGKNKEECESELKERRKGENRDVVIWIMTVIGEMISSLTKDDQFGTLC
jgi:hypothetical protein